MRKVKAKKHLAKNLTKNAVSIPKIEGACESVASILKELSHPQRLLILGHLLRGPKTVSQLVKSCGTSQSQMSHFLMRMKYAGLIQSEKAGKFQFYSVADQRLIQLMKTIQNEYCKG
ncbi:MAG TPA: metalloregulator ArsR/SmtB family transcription factor [Pseudobdellovibrionaceae bacterium]|jgi:DNA-binding transcriptional ArsR family regulator